VVNLFGGRIASALVGISVLAMGSSASAQDYSRLNVAAAVKALDVDSSATPLGSAATLANTLARPAVAATSRSAAEEDAIATLMALGERRTEAEHLLDRAIQSSPGLKTTDAFVREMLRLRTVRS